MTNTWLQKLFLRKSYLIEKVKKTEASFFLLCSFASLTDIVSKIKITFSFSLRYFK